MSLMWETVKGHNAVLGKRADHPFIFKVNESFPDSLRYVVLEIYRKDDDGKEQRIYSSGEGIQFKAVCPAMRMAETMDMLIGVSDAPKPGDLEGLVNE